MPVDILNLKPTVISKNLRGKYVLIYGPPKIGKTSLAAQFPKTIIAAFEPGTNALNKAMVQPILKWAEFRQMVNQLDNPAAKEMYDTVVIDTADIAWDYCEQYICANNPDETTGATPKRLGDIPWGAGYDLCKKEYDSQFRKIAMMGYGMVFISHEQSKTLKNEKGEEYEKFMPTLPDRPRLIVNRMVDIIGYLRNVEADDGTKKRVMFTRDNMIFEAGSRFPYLIPKIELSYKNLVDAIQNAIDEQIEKEGGETTDEFVNNYVSDGKTFEEVMNEARAVWVTHAEKGDEVISKMMDIIEKQFGRRMKLSEATAEQQDTLEAVIAELKNL